MADQNATGIQNVKMVAGTINAFNLTQDNNSVSDRFTINDPFAPLEEDTGPLPWESFFSPGSSLSLPRLALLTLTFTAAECELPATGSYFPH